MNRRSFISLVKFFPFLGLGKFLTAKSLLLTNKFESSLKRDSNKILDVHSALRYRIISKKGSIMSDGYKVPALADGMGSFAVNDNIVLVRNHELLPSDGMKEGAFENPSSQIRKMKNNHYDKKSIGGTTNIILKKGTNEVIKEYLSLSGTNDNCAGGITPWNTWLSCEENINKKKKNETLHGYIFEVDPKKEFLEKPVPLKSMGRFKHEAVAFDKFNNGYLTEDRSDGLIYKFVPKTDNSLKEGKLYALKINNQKDSRNWNSSSIEIGKKYSIDWIKIKNPNPEDDTLRYEGMSNGATPFARPEGIINDGDSIYICCTSGGPLNRGQIWKLTTIAPNKSFLKLWYEVQNRKTLNMPDNLTIAPWGDLILCEDNSRTNRLWGIHPMGKPYLIAENNYSNSEFAGACFSPYDNTMFVNLQKHGLTLAINGNWNNVYNQY